LAQSLPASPRTSRPFASFASGRRLIDGGHVKLLEPLRKQRSPATMDWAMAYCISLADDLPRSVRAVAQQQLQSAVDVLQRMQDPVDAVHEARKHIKKTRALLRLVRPALGRSVYRRENDALREVALVLSERRDADVLEQTIQRLLRYATGSLPSATAQRLSRQLCAHSLPAGEADLAAALGALSTLSANVEHWPLDDLGWRSVIAGCTRVYRQGRDACALARADPSTERLHDWRKHAKDLWYHQRLLVALWPAVIPTYSEQAHTLSELLGDDHDLALLGARLQSPGELPADLQAAAVELSELGEARRGELRAAAHGLAALLYAESPKAFSRRLERYVEGALAQRQLSTGSA
jgi:CHAD domain-containing protein